MNNPIRFIDPDGMAVYEGATFTVYSGEHAGAAFSAYMQGRGTSSSHEEDDEEKYLNGPGPEYWRKIKDDVKQLVHNLPKIEVSSKVTFGIQAGLNFMNLASLDFVPAVVTLAETKHTLEKGKYESDLKLAGDGDGGIKTESKMGINLGGQAIEGGFTFQTYLQDGIYSKDTKMIVKRGGVFKDSFLKGLSPGGKISTGIGKSFGSQVVSTTVYGQTKVTQERSIKFSAKLLLGAEISIKY